MTHISEAVFEDRLVRWYENHGHAPMTQVYQGGPSWFVDLVVERPDVTLYIEVENDAPSIREGVGQAQGYAADDPNGIPMVVVPAGHTESPDIQRLRRGSPGIIRAFDSERGVWI